MATNQEIQNGRESIAKILLAKKKNHRAFGGCRVQQNSAKRKQMQARDRRLRKIGLAITHFDS